MCSCLTVDKTRSENLKPNATQCGGDWPDTCVYELGPCTCGCWSCGPKLNCCPMAGWVACRGCYCWSGSIPVMFGFGDFQKHGEDGDFKMTNKCGGCLGIAGAWNGSAMYTKKDQSGAPGSAEMER